jgi:His/Glu/Gln/Arg/opine family amino acid ABC transporter permease subunit
MRPARPVLSLLRTAFGQSRFAQVINLIVMTASIALIWQALSWGVFRAVAPWQAASLCTPEAGACWPFLLEKLPLILFGTFPFEERWRPLIASLSLFAMSCVTLFQLASWRWQLAGWLASLVMFTLLMGDGAGLLKAVPHAQWNGLPVLLFLGTVSLAAALPVGLGLVLCRQSGSAMLRVPATIMIETLRGIPMVAVLFFGVFVLPVMVGQQALAPIHAALVVLVFFHGAYVAEDLRSGLHPDAAARDPAAGDPGRHPRAHQHRDRWLQGHLADRAGRTARPPVDFQDGGGRTPLAGLCAGGLRVRGCAFLPDQRTDRAGGAAPRADRRRPQVKVLASTSAPVAKSALRGGRYARRARTNNDTITRDPALGHGTPNLPINRKPP